MITLFQFALLTVSALASAVPIGNYIVNKIHGMCPSKNRQESTMWGIVFIACAAFDYLVLWV